MPQSLVKNYIHLTFSTKNRYAFIDEYIEVELFSYLGGICKNLECYPLAAGGIQGSCAYPLFIVKEDSSNEIN